MPKRPASKKTSLFPLAIVVSRYNATITDELLYAAAEEYAAAGGQPDDLIVIDAPGSYELPALCLHAARSGEFAGVLALGCIIKGETDHDQYIANAVAQGLVNITINTGIPVAFGVLTTDTVEQAQARAGGDKGNKGQEAMAALIETVYAVQALGGKAASRSQRSSARPDKARRR